MSARRIEAGEAFVRGSYDGSDLEKGLRLQERRLRAAAKTIGSVGRSLFAFGATGAAALAPTIAAASRLEETMNKFNVVFGENAKAVKAWGDEFAGQVGRAKGDVANFLSGFQDLLVPIGFEEGAATDVSKELTQLTVDLASFNNMAEPAVVRDLQAALTGSGEVMKKYGVIVSEAAVKQELLRDGMDPRAATEQQKVMARLAIILRGTTAAQGDAVRSADSFANQMKRLWGVTQDAAAAIGSKLLPIVTPIVSRVASVVSVVGEWIEESSLLVPLLAGVTAASVSLGGAAIALSTAITGLSVALKVVGPQLDSLTGRTMALAAAQQAAAATSGSFSGHLLGSAANARRAAAPVGLLGRAATGLRSVMGFFVRSPLSMIVGGATGIGLLWTAYEIYSLLTRQSTELSKAVRLVADADRDRVARLNELSKVQRLTATEIIEARSLIGALESAYGGFGVTVDDVNRKLVGTVDGLDAVGQKIRDIESKVLGKEIEELSEKIRKNVERVEKAEARVESLRGTRSGGRERNTAATALAAARSERARLDAERQRLQARVDELNPAAATADSEDSGGGVAGAAAAASADASRRRVADELAEAQIRAREEGLAEELALLDEQHRQRVRDLETEGTLTDELRGKLDALLEARRSEAVAADRARRDADARAEAERRRQDAAAAQQDLNARLADARVANIDDPDERARARAQLEADRDVRNLRSLGLEQDETDELVAKRMELLGLELDAIDAQEDGLAVASADPAVGGTFSSAVADIFRGGGEDRVQQDILAANEETRDNTREIADRARRGGILLG